MSKTNPIPDRTPLVSLTEVQVVRGGTTLLDRVSLTVAPGEIVTLIGPNGAGKSTLVKVALGLIKPQHGAVWRPAGLRVGYVPQSIDLDPTLPLTVQRFLQLARPRQSPNFAATLAQVGGENLLTQSMHRVSGGELRRILLARALLVEPQLLILDEPTAGVDFNGQSALYRLILDLRERLQCGVLLVSHNLYIVMAATDRVVCLNRHVCCLGPPEVVQNHPEFRTLFGPQHVATLGFYHHHHDHEHELHGGIKSQ